MTRAPEASEPAEPAKPAEPTPPAGSAGPAAAGGARWWARAVLDTSVLLGKDRHWLWLLARQGLYEGVWSAFIVGELVRIRTELSLRHGVPRAEYRRRINALVHLLSDVLQIVGVGEQGNQNVR